jgi:hypothetical protein
MQVSTKSHFFENIQGVPKVLRHLVNRLKLHDKDYGANKKSVRPHIKRL